jgi:poly(3-hydroxybutyrate) depolymerase
MAPLSAARGGCAALLLAAAAPAYAQSKLASYNVRPETVTVTGISSGGFMAVQLEVAYSSHFHGTAIFAGGPYDCAQDSESTGEGACVSGSGLSVPTLIGYTDQQADAGTIDPTTGLAGKPVYLFSGTQDTVVHQAVMDDLQQYLEHYVSASEITYDNTTAAGHGWISPDGPNACDATQLPYINNCSIDPEDTFLTLFYGPLAAKNTGTLGGTFIQFDQDELCGGACSAISMDSTAWLYVPAACASGQACKLVVVLHGCLQYQGLIQEQLVKESGVDEWADTNDIVVLYPQTTTSLSNPAGCWDWWGYTGSGYPLRGAPQMAAIIAMVDRITGADGGSQTGSADAGNTGSGDGGLEGGGDGGTGVRPAGGCGCGTSTSGLGALALGCALALALRKARWRERPPMVWER